jgi:hypothetical protein
MPMPRTTASKPGPSAADVEAKELRKRIERLEERMDESILGDDGLAQIAPGLDSGIDKSASGDALQKAVRRSNAGRGSRKA